MLFDSSLRRELGRHFTGTLVVMTTIILTMMLVRTLNQAASGSFAPQDVMRVLAYTGLGHSPTILTLTLFISVVSVISRMYGQSEMVIWLSSGMGLARLLGPLLRFCWPIVAVIVILVLFIWPWANQQTEDLKKQFEMRSDLSRVEPGKFQESSNGTRVFFIDKSTETQGYGRNVFVVAREGDKEVITSASGGHIENRDGQSFLVLEGGQRLESDTKTGEHRLVFFEKYGTLQGDKPLGRIDNRRPSTIPTSELLTHTQPVLQGELAWRLGLPMAALNFVLIGLLAADMNPRSGRSWSLTLALLSFLVYYNLINITQAYIGAGRIGMIPMFIGLHGTVLALALLWLSKKHWGWSWLGGSSK